ncbi:MAG: ABC transporter ATP-binding protein [Candidatus Hydrogenedentes bacterium]|nr:ABC transporter ATP-binding protein [Candidatus Hydrogenedentota bacterium]
MVSIENLEISYELGGETLRVLDIPTWSVAAGEQVAVAGPSGCGKSTLLHVVSGILAPDKGSVEVCGKRLDQMSEVERDRHRAAHIGYIFQNFNLLQGFSAVENVLLGATFSGRHISRADAESLLRQVGLGHRLKHRPSEMSLGEQQRVAVARALANRPQLLLADEPTGSLDPVHTDEIIRMLRDVSRDHGCSLVVVSHEHDIIEQFERIDRFMDINRAFASVRGTTI